MAQVKFKKKVYTFSVFMKDFLFFHGNALVFVRDLFHRKISKKFESRIMLAVTSVNGCKYCAWFHSKDALKAGIGSEEIKRLLSSQLGGQVEDGEMAALNFAFHYAETDQRPDPALVKDLFEVYGDKAAYEILLKLRLIYFGNLCGNTFEGFLSRLKGTKPDNSFWLSELIIFLLISPMYVPLAMLMNNDKGGPAYV